MKKISIFFSLFFLLHFSQIIFIQIFIVRKIELTKSDILDEMEGSEIKLFCTIRNANEEMLRIRSVTWEQNKAIINLNQARCVLML